MERTCIKCFKVKPLEDFKKLHGDGYSNYCESCRGSARRSMQRRMTTEERTEAHKKWRESETHKASTYQVRSNLKALTGLTLEEYQALEDAQEGKCYICEKHLTETAFSRLHVDHCHKTLKIRKLLCSNCNTAIGLLKDDPRLVNKVLEYITADYSTSIDYRGTRQYDKDGWKNKAKNGRLK